jgi:glycogen synthase
MRGARSSPTLLKLALQKKLLTSLALMILPSTLFFYFLPLKPPPNTIPRMPIPKLFEPRLDEDIIPTRHTTLFWKEKNSQGELHSGYSLINESPELPSTQTMHRQVNQFADMRLKYLGALPGWSKDAFAATDTTRPTDLHFGSLDRAGRFVELSSRSFPSAVKHIEVFGSLGNQLLVAIVLDREKTFHIYKVTHEGETQLAVSKETSFPDVANVLLPFGEKSLVSIDGNELRLHAFSFQDEQSELREKVLPTPQFSKPDLVARVPYQESIALVMHNQNLRTVQVLAFNSDSKEPPTLISLDNDEKWDELIRTPHSRKVIFYKKKSALHNDRVNIVASQSPTQWSVEKSFSTHRSIEHISAIGETTLQESNFQPFGHATNPIRALHVTLEYNQSEIGGIAAVTKTLLPKLNRASQSEAIKADVIMPKFSFLKLHDRKMKKLAEIEHYYDNTWVKSVVFETEPGLLVVAPDGDLHKDIFHINDKTSMYTEEDSAIPIKRWLYFNSAVAAFVSLYKDSESHQPYHILHMHSYHVSVAAELLDLYAASRLQSGIEKPKTIFHMHGLSYDQGWIKGQLLDEIGLRAESEWENLTKRTFDVIDYVVTVSEHMFKDGLSDNAQVSYGLSSLFRSLWAGDRVHPVLNGITISQWDPTNKLLLPPQSEDLTFDADHIDDGKKRIKSYLKTQGYFRDDDRPLVTFVGRFSDEKGIEHLLPAVREVVKLGGNFAIMGSYSKSFNCREMLETLKDLAKTEFLGRLLIIDTVEEQKLNHLGNYVRAASDFSFVPSKEETCGLVPLEFFCFGAMTITSYVGGLRDTVVPYEKGKEHFNGFIFNYSDPDHLYWSINEAFSFIKTKPQQFRDLRRRLMNNSTTFDWSTPGGAVSKIVSLYMKAIET